MDKNKSQITPNEYLDLFENAMKKLSIAADKPMGEARTLIYFEHLHVYSMEEVQAAVNRAIHEEEYSQIAPVGKLIRYIEEERETQRNTMRSRTDLIEIENNPGAISPERAKQIIKEVNAKIREIVPDWDKEMVGDVRSTLRRLKNSAPTLTGEEGVAFEEKRQKAKIKLVR